MAIKTTHEIRLPQAKAAPEILEQEIERIRSHMDENLALLGRKLSPVRLKALRTPLAAIFLGVMSIVLYRRFRRGWRVRPTGYGQSPPIKTYVRKVRLGPLNGLSQLRTLLQLIAVAGKGKPAVFIVQPVKKG